MPGKPTTAHQKAGATTPSEKFSARLSIAARTTPASSSDLGIAADDMGDRGATLGESALLQFLGDGGDVRPQAPLGHQAACDQREDQRRHGKRHQREQADLNGQARHGGCRQNHGEHHDPGHATTPRGILLPVHGSVEGGNERSAPGHRVAEPREKPRRIADQRFQNEGEGRNREVGFDGHGNRPLARVLPQTRPCGASKPKCSKPKSRLPTSPPRQSSVNLPCCRFPAKAGTLKRECGAGTAVPMPRLPPQL